MDRSWRFLVARRDIGRASCAVSSVGSNLHIDTSLHGVGLLMPSGVPGPLMYMAIRILVTEYVKLDTGLLLHFMQFFNFCFEYVPPSKSSLNCIAIPLQAETFMSVHKQLRIIQMMGFEGFGEAIDPVAGL